MKRTFALTALSLSLLFLSPVFADTIMPASNVAKAMSSRCESQGNNISRSDRNALVALCLASENSPANVSAVVAKQKLAYCEQNAKNKRMQGSEREGYITTCMQKNEAQLAFQAAANRQIASTEVNEVLQQAPTAAGDE